MSLKLFGSGANAGHSLVSGAPPFIAAPFTIIGWATDEAAATTNDDTLIEICDRSAGDQYWKVERSSSGNNLGFTPRGPTSFTNISTSTTLPTDGSWFMWGVSEGSSTDHRVYLEGGGEGSSTDNRVPANIDTIDIGREGDLSPNDSWDGRIAHIAMWNVAFTAAEHAFMRANRLHPYAYHRRRQNLIFYLRLQGSDWLNYQDEVGGIAFRQVGVGFPDLDAVAGIGLIKPVYDDHEIQLNGDPYYFSDPFIGAAPAVGGLGIPTAMHSYRQRRVA